MSSCCPPGLGEADETNANWSHDWNDVITYKAIDKVGYLFAA